VVVDSRLFDDPCPGTVKYLEVQYYCAHKGKLLSLLVFFTLSCSVAVRLPLVLVHMRIQSCRLLGQSHTLLILYFAFIVGFRFDLKPVRLRVKLDRFLAQFNPFGLKTVFACDCLIYLAVNACSMRFADDSHLFTNHTLAGLYSPSHPSLTHLDPTGVTLLFYCAALSLLDLSVRHAETSGQILLHRTNWGICNFNCLASTSLFVSISSALACF
jgi:hypothetical protein